MDDRFYHSIACILQRLHYLSHNINTFLAENRDYFKSCGRRIIFSFQCHYCHYHLCSHFTQSGFFFLLILRSAIKHTDNDNIDDDDFIIPK